MVPQLGAGGGMPSPRNESDASDKTEPAIPSDAWTISGWIEFGIICVNRIRMLLAPRAFAAWTKSYSRTFSTCPHHAGVSDPSDDAEGKNEFAESGSQKCYECDRKQQPGERKEHIK